jgi:hypothetical protein
MTTTIEGASSPGEFGARPVQESLLAATAHLEAVIASAPPADPWFHDLRTALQECTLALEHHLDTIDGSEGLKEHLGREEPRLLRRLDQLDAELNELLVEFWEAKESSAAPQARLIEPLAHLAAELRRAADGELELIHESLIAIGPGD